VVFPMIKSPNGSQARDARRLIGSVTEKFRDRKDIIANCHVILNEQMKVIGVIEVADGRIILKVLCPKGCNPFGEEKIEKRIRQFIENCSV
jgi:hypothetical protein